MTGVSLNLYSNNPAQNIKDYAQKQKSLKEEFENQHKKNGFVEKAYNGVKNVTNLGTGSKKVQQVIEKAERGEISEKEASKIIKNYRNSQATSAQIFSDAASITAAASTFFALNKYSKYTTAGIKVNKPCEDFAKKLIEDLSKNAKGNEKAQIEKVSKFLNKTLDTLKSDKKMLGITIGLAALAGGFAKLYTQKINRFGSNEFKTDKKDFNGAKTAEDKKAYKAAKKANRKAKRKADLRGFGAGIVNGLMMPVTLLGGAIGAPLYVVGNSLNRYFVADYENKGNKSFGGYVDNLKNDALLHTGLAVATAIPLYKKGNWTKVFNENISKVTKNLSDAKLSKPDFEAKSAFNEIKDLAMGSDDIQRILNDANLTDQQKAQKIIDSNIFAAKMKQIDTQDSVGRVLKDSCPTTRCFRDVNGKWDFSNAQKYVDEKLGKGYKITKSLGAGTVAETYLAKDPNGKEVCIKVLKEGMSAEKIKADADVLKTTIEKLPDTVANRQKKDYLQRNLDDLMDGILQEVDFNKESLAAQKIAKVTSKANVVKPILVKNNVYVMEKAEGITLASFLDINKLYAEKEAAEKMGQDSSKIIEQINKLKERMPDFKDVNFDKKDTEFLLNEYQKVFIEQFHKIDPNGKIIHGDIHPGNIFINPEVLKTKKGNLFTLIDTGNIIDMSANQSIRALNISKYIDNGNVEEIAKYVLDGAKHPGKTKEEAHKIVVDELKKLFFDNKTMLNGHMYEAKVLGITDNIMQKYQIIPANTQLNLNKTRASATTSLEQIKAAINNIEAIKIGQAIVEGNTVTAGVEGSKMVAKNIAKNKYYDAMIKQQEKMNLANLSKEQINLIKNNPTALDTSSAEYITYQLKQNILPKEVFERIV